MSVDDRYTYRDSGGVLVNKLDLRDQQQLDTALNRYASVGWAVIRSSQVDVLDFSYLRHIHEVLFSPVLAWAGVLRDVDVQAGGTGIPYGRPQYIQSALDDLFGQLSREDYLAGIDDHRVFARRLAEKWGYLTHIHPFRDGNTRSQSVYIGQLARRAGHPIDWTRVNVDRLRDLRLAAVGGSEAPLADYLTFLTMPHDGSSTGDDIQRFRGSTSVASGSAVPSGASLRCARWMPRARKPCALPEAHGDHCRSKARGQ